MKLIILMVISFIAVSLSEGHLPICDHHTLKWFSNTTKVTFKEYKPLFAEMGWFKQSDNWKSQTTGFCDEMAKEATLMSENVRATMSLMEERKIPHNYVLLEHLYSQMVYDVELDRTSNQHPNIISISEFVEPLLGLLRDPFAIPCGAHLGRAVPSSQDLVTDASQSKRNILLNPHAPKIISSNFAQVCITTETLPFESWYRGRVLIFDLGATLFGSWGKEVSAAAGGWFYRMLRTANVEIDHYWAFEASVIAPSQVWGAVPADLRGKYTYINIPVSPNPESPDYPWNVLIQAARSQDYVIVKVDIDTPNIENPIVDHLLTNPKYLRLIDEFLFEHHVDIEAMHRWWGGDQGLSLSDSYRIFTQFREKGVRSHAWP